MHAPASFDYAILRVVPRVERQEFMNAGIIVFCLEKRYLAARVHLDEDRLRALWPEADAALVTQHLEAIPRICAGDQEAGPIALDRKSTRLNSSHLGISYAVFCLKK